MTTKHANAEGGMYSLGSPTLGAVQSGGAVCIGCHDPLGDSAAVVAAGFGAVARPVVGCESCHGRIDQMVKVYQAKPLTMEWCINCHRHPEQYIRPKDQVFSMEWTPPNGDQLALGRKLVKEYDIQVRLLTNCSTCHR